MPVSSKTIKITSAVFIALLLLPVALLSIPKNVQAQWAVIDAAVLAVIQGESVPLEGVGAAEQTVETATSVKTWAKDILRELAKAAAMKALQEITKSTVNWINSGYHGSPLFIENPDSFFRDIAKFEVKNLVDIFGYDTLRFPFGKDWALSTINAYKGQLDMNTAYTLSKVSSDPVLIRNYQTDFNTGGWNAFLINTQYPQNNPIGFQMIATERLAKKVQGTSQTAKEKVEKTLAQGMGFLSPKACPTNPKYNNGFNEFRQPSWNQSKYEKEHPYEPPECDSRDAAHTPDPKTNICPAEITYDTLWFSQQNEAKRIWTKDNSCPGGLVATTPGSVVANQIIKSVQSPTTLKEMAINSGSTILSAVFDHLLNTLWDKGVNALASRSNQPEEDTWSYNGLTLGSSGEGGANYTWDAGPDEEIVLVDFKELVDKSIADTKVEIGYLNDTLNEFNLIWPEARSLDICIPGPDIKWQERLQEEKNKNTRFEGETPQQTELANSAREELDFAVSFFKDWIYNKMTVTLPNSITYLSLVDSIKNLPQQATGLTRKRDTRSDALAQLESIKTALAAITTQPEPGSVEEGTMAALKAQYNSLQVSFTNSYTLGEARNDLAMAQSRKNSLKGKTSECETAREAAGWGVPGGWQSSYNKATDVPALDLGNIEPNSEQALFCNIPILGGYSHGTFVGPDIVIPRLPMVNAKDVIEGISIAINCDTVFRADILDYKGSLSGSTPITETPP